MNCPKNRLVDLKIIPKLKHRKAGRLTFVQIKAAQEILVKLTPDIFQIRPLHDQRHVQVDVSETKRIKGRLLALEVA
jgi:hypothetical protein